MSPEVGELDWEVRADADARWFMSNRYLLGSGGTLVFDLTIMIQSLVYGSAPPIDERDQEDYIEPIESRDRRHRSHSHSHGHGHGRSRSSRRHSKRVADEESRPLLSGGGGGED